MPVVIETHNLHGYNSEWGVSLTSSNPEWDQYVACPTQEVANRVCAALELLAKSEEEERNRKIYEMAQRVKARKEAEEDEARR